MPMLGGGRRPLVFMITMATLCNFGHTHFKEERPLQFKEQSRHLTPHPQKQQDEDSSTKSAILVMYGKKCTSITECSIQLGMTCAPANSTSDSGTCVCTNERPIFVPGIQRCVIERKLGSNCSSPDSCTDSFTVCHKGTCVCEDSHEVRDGSCISKESYLLEGLLSWLVPPIIAVIVIFCLWRARFRKSSLKSPSQMPQYSPSRRGLLTFEADTVSGTTALSCPARGESLTYADITNSAANLSRADGDVVDGLSVGDEGDLTAHLSTLDNNRGFSLSGGHSPCPLPVISEDVFAKRYPHLATAGPSLDGKQVYRDKGDESTAKKDKEHACGMVSIREEKTGEITTEAGPTPGGHDDGVRQLDNVSKPQDAVGRSEDGQVHLTQGADQPHQSKDKPPAPTITGACYEVTWETPALHRFAEIRKGTNDDKMQPQRTPDGVYITMKCRRQFTKVRNAVRSSTTLSEESSATSIDDSENCSESSCQRDFSMPGTSGITSTDVRTSTMDSSTVCDTRCER
ncbi:uncharacterized protein LOC135400271 [Ornithodoros turicata]|uniref:uncharacterized protein LOC135400271 n=1 Tax=Ornithodoros turicata TaxID=34597 RepID=UPI0031395FE2